MEAKVNVMGVTCPIAIKGNDIVVNNTVIFTDTDKNYLQWKLEGYLQLGLTIREQAIVAYNNIHEANC